VPNILTLTVEDPDAILTLYSAGALIRWERGGSAIGPFVEQGTVPIVSGDSSYQVSDVTGLSTAWYRTRYSNAGATIFGDYSDPFQVDSSNVSLIRQRFLDKYLRRREGDPVPWSDAECDQAIADALAALWNDGIGHRAQGTASPSSSSDVYTIPAAFTNEAGQGRVSRIELEQTAGGTSARVAKVTSWEYYSDTQVRIQPALPSSSTLTLRFFGWVPFLLDGTDLPVRLQSVVAMKAAALSFGQLAGLLTNSQSQQGMDSGRVVDYQTAVGLSAYWERRYRDALDGDQNLKSYAPRHAFRG
jgi:hypothetical protein